MSSPDGYVILAIPDRTPATHRLSTGNALSISKSEVLANFKQLRDMMYTEQLPAVINTVALTLDDLKAQACLVC